MHNNYYFLKQLSAQLNERLHGATLATCFSQNKNELVIGLIDKNNADFYIKAHLDPSFCCLYFPENFQRARKNSVDLFTELIGLHVLEVRQFLNERCFALIFDNEEQLIFKMQGNRSNVIWCDASGAAKKLFNNKLKNDWTLNTNHLDRPLNQNKKAFVDSNGALKELFPTFGKVVLQYLKATNYYELSLDKQWDFIEDLLKKLNASTYYIIENKGLLFFSLLDFYTVKKTYQQPLEALNDFFITYSSTKGLQNLKKQVLQHVDKVIKQSTNYIEKTFDKLAQIQDSISYSQQADLLMANLHQIDPDSKEVTLPNFYNQNRPITIKLKPTLSPQKNAEVYYRKAKNQSKEINNLEKSLDHKERLVENYKHHKIFIEHNDDFKTLKNYIRQHDLIKTEHQESSQSLPFQELSFQDFKIYIGKNARSNDKMLQQYTYKEDLWLHAKDVSGSHVIIKNQAGKNFPKNVIEYAAQLAAANSKRKNDSLCPVIVTPRKYVRKRKGDPPGAVVVEKEEVILVEPKKADQS